MKRLLIIFVFVIVFAENNFAAKLLFDFNDRLIGTYNTNEECVMARKADINANYGGNNNIKYKVFWEEHNEWWEIGIETLDTNNVNIDNNIENSDKSNVIYAGNIRNNNMLTTEQIMMQSEGLPIVFSSNNENQGRGNNNSLTKEEAIKKREMDKSYVRANSTSRVIIYNTKDRKETITY